MALNSRAMKRFQHELGLCLIFIERYNKATIMNVYLLQDNESALERERVIVKKLI